MTNFDMNPVTQRNLKTHFQAFVDNSYPAEDFWSVTGDSPVLERGSDVTMTGELAIVHDDGPLRTGFRLTGNYETYWSYNSDQITLALISPGTRTLGAVSAGAHDLGRSSVFTITTTNTFDDGGLFVSLGSQRAYRKVAGTDAIICPLGGGIHHVGLDVLIDDKHQVCGFVFNGEDEYVFEERILAEESARLSTLAILKRLATAPPQSLVEVMAADGKSLGILTDCDPVFTWTATVGGAHASTVEEIVDEARDFLGADSIAHIDGLDPTDPACQLGMRVGDQNARAGAWVGGIDVADDRVVLHLLEVAPLPDTQPR